MMDGRNLANACATTCDRSSSGNGDLGGSEEHERDVAGAWGRAPRHARTNLSNSAPEGC